MQCCYPRSSSAIQRQVVFWHHSKSTKPVVPLHYNVLDWKAAVKISLAIFNQWPEKRKKWRKTVEKQAKIMWVIRIRGEAQQQSRGQSVMTAKQVTLKRGQEWTVWLKSTVCLFVLFACLFFFFFYLSSLSFVVPLTIGLISCLARCGRTDGGRKVQTSPWHRLGLLHGYLDFGSHHVHYTFAHIYHLWVKRIMKN